jgi:hypothetical protein
LLYGPERQKHGEIWQQGPIGKPADETQTIKKPLARLSSRTLFYRALVPLAGMGIKLDLFGGQHLLGLTCGVTIR